MGLIQPKYTDTQRDAVRRAGLDLAMRPKEIQDAAKAGRLTWDGAPVPAFEIPASTAYSIVREERRKRDGRTRSQLLQRPHVDAVEELRRRMVAVADHETARMVDVQRKKPNDPLDGEHFRRLCRGLRELASLPEPGTQGERPGAHVPGQGLPKGEATAKPNTMRGQLEAAIDRGAAPGSAQGDPVPDLLEGKERGEDVALALDGSPRAQGEDGGDEGGEGEGPGSWAREQFAGLTATHVDGTPVAG